MNQYKDKIGVDHIIEPCPSPAGVNHYELVSKIWKMHRSGFSSPTGLTIMNVVNYDYWTHMFVFPSPTGVNHYESRMPFSYA